MVMTNSLKEYFMDDLFMKQQYYLLSWIINSKRTNMEYIEEKNDFENLLTLNLNCNLFKIINTPEKENEFKNIKDTLIDKETEFAYHGSALCNWHSIIRNSLQNLSGTNYQLNGASYGHGIYLAKDFVTSVQYSSRSNKIAVLSQFECSYSHCVLVVEKYKNININNSIPNHIYVVNNDKLIIMRYIIALK